MFSSLLPLVRPVLPAYDTDIAGEFSDIFKTGVLTKGKFLERFEAGLAEHLGVRHAIAVSSCTMGLLLVYHGLGLRGEVIAPSFTFMATIHPLVWVGAEPVFVDIDAQTWNIDPAKVEEAINDRTTAIVAVHNFGNPAPVRELEQLARRYNLKCVFDAAHGFGSVYRGNRLGRNGDAEVFSLSPTKLVVAGEGGVVATNDDRLANHVRVAREYGNPGDYGSNTPGLNARLSELNAVLGLHSLAQLEVNVARRTRAAHLLRMELAEVPGLEFQKIHPDDRSSYKDFSVLVDESAFGLSRDELIRALRAENIDTRKYYDPPVHKHKTYRHLAPQYENKLPSTEEVARRSLSLPIWSNMEDQIVEAIGLAVRRIQVHAALVKQALVNGAAVLL